MKLAIILALVVVTIAYDCKIKILHPKNEIIDHKESGFVVESFGDKGSVPFGFFRSKQCSVEKNSNDFNPTWNIHNAIEDLGLQRRERSDDAHIGPTILVFVESYSDFYQTRDYVEREEIIRSMKYTNTYAILVGLREVFYNDFMTKTETCWTEQKQTFRYSGWLHERKCSVETSKKNPNIYVVDKFFADKYKTGMSDTDEILFDLEILQVKQNYGENLKIAINGAIFDILSHISLGVPHQDNDTMGDMCDNCRNHPDLEMEE